jgi:hypothetical protein
MRELKTLGRENADDTFLWITGVLETRCIPYQLTGGVAAKVYGALREVNDIDLEVPDEQVALLEPDVRPFLIEGPGPLKDEWWDIGAILVLDVRGQFADISGANAVKIFDTQTRRGWVEASSDLTTAERHIVCGKEVPVVAREFLAQYKRLLFGDHQRSDVAAVERAMREET